MNEHDIDQLLTAVTDGTTPVVDLTEVGLRYEKRNGERYSPHAGGLLVTRGAPPLLVSVPDALDHLRELEQDAKRCQQAARKVRQRIAAALADIPEEG